MRIAHITDIHVLSLEGVSPLSFLSQRLLGGANLLFNRAGEYPVEVAELLISDINAQGVDHVVVSGDLTNLSLGAEFLRAREVLEGLSVGPEGVTVVPGNHDCYTLSEYLAGDFAKILAPFLMADIRPWTSAFPFARLLGDVALIAVDSSHPSLPLLATGRVGKRQRQRLETLLTHPDIEGRFKLVAVHHPPRSPYASWHKRLVDGGALVSLLERCGGDLLVHGHLHRELRDRLAGPGGKTLAIVGSNSSTWATEDADRRASYNIYTIEDGAAAVSRRRLRDGARVFESADGLPI